MLQLVGRHRWALLVGLGVVAGTAVLSIPYGLQAIAAPAAVLLIYLAAKLGTGPLARLIARSRLSLRWKISGTVFLILGVLLSVLVANLAAIQNTHDEIHAIQEFREARTTEPGALIQGTAATGDGSPLEARNFQMTAALDRLESRQHTILAWTPLVGFVGGLVAIALGAALSSSLIRPLGAMGAATRRIAAGDFSQPVHVSNRDELGELATSLNRAAQDLARLQEALLAEEQARALHERMIQVTSAQEEERRRISRELHDGLGPSLAALGNRIRVSQQLILDDPPKAQAGLDEVIVALRGHVGEIRELINELRPLTLDQLGLVEALRQHVERFGQETGIDASFSVSGAPPTDPLSELTVYRVVQESLTNVRKHARASAVQVSLRNSSDGVEVVVADDGNGFDAELVGAQATNGMGLTSMRERAELMRGTLTVQTSDGGGCQVALRMPARE